MRDPLADDPSLGREKMVLRYPAQLLRLSRLRGRVV